MPDASSAEAAAVSVAADAARAGRRALELTLRTRAAMVALGFIPSLHIVAAAAPFVLAVTGRAPLETAWLAPVLLYLPPPLIVRAATFWRPIVSGRVGMDSSAFLHWWFSAQWQVVFARLPFLEELLRLLPGVYSMWLRLWGARIGSLVYWAPGVAILDRPLLRIGSRVVFGVGVRLNGHVLSPGPHGATELYAGCVSIGDDALIGGYSVLLPGCAVGAGEITPAFRTMHAFSRYESGRRVATADSPVKGTS